MAAAMMTGTPAILSVPGLSCNGKKISSSRQNPCKPLGRVSFNQSFPTYVSRPSISLTRSSMITSESLSSSSCYSSNQFAPLEFRKRIKPLVVSGRDVRSYSSRKPVVELKVEDVRGGMTTSLVKYWKQISVSILAACVLGSCYVVMRVAPLVSPVPTAYSDLVVGIESGKVKKIHVKHGSTRVVYNTVTHKPENINAALVENSSWEASLVLAMDRALMRLFNKKISDPQWQFSTIIFERDGDFIEGLARENKIAYSATPRSMLSAAIRQLDPNLISLLSMVPFIYFTYRQFSVGSSKSRKWRRSNEKIGFDEVQGVDAAKEELMELVACLRGTIDYKKLGAKIPRGVLLIGPPGTGKTQLARAVAGEAGVPFFIVSGSEFVECFVGRGAARVRDLFNQARKCSPSIIFIDELDAIGGKRGRTRNDEGDHTLVQLLTEIDGFDSNSRVIVLAATNRPGFLDPALCRPGRFSRKVTVGVPDRDGRRKILAVHMKNVPLEDDLDHTCEMIASLTPGLVGADLANIVNESALLAARRGGDAVSKDDILEALNRAKNGIGKENQAKSEGMSQEASEFLSWMSSNAKSMNEKDADAESSEWDQQPFSDYSNDLD